MITERRLKILEIATALLLLFFFAALFYEIESNSAWLIALLFLLSIFAIFYTADQRNKFYSRPVIVPRPPPPPAASRKTAAEMERDKKAAHEIVVELCKSKNIDLNFKHDYIGGHCDIPETWEFERPVPLTYEDISLIVANSYLTAEMRVQSDGIIYAEGFAIYSERIIYRSKT